MRKKIVLIIGAALLSGTAAAVMTGGGFWLISRWAGMGSSSGGGDYSVVNSAGDGVGAEPMSGGDYSLGASISAITASSNKLENDLTQAHCYPNPYKPNSGLGHTKITFSRLTSHSKLKIFNVAGELVYDTEADTPNGEFAWNAVNNKGEKLASGVYVYLVIGNNNYKAKGRFSVIK